MQQVMQGYKGCSVSNQESRKLRTWLRLGSRGRGNQRGPALGGTVRHILQPGWAAGGQHHQRARLALPPDQWGMPPLTHHSRPSITAIVLCIWSHRQMLHCDSPGSCVSSTVVLDRCHPSSQWQARRPRRLSPPAPSQRQPTLPAHQPQLQRKQDQPLPAFIPPPQHQGRPWTQAGRQLSLPPIFQNP